MENVCISVDDDAFMYAVGSKSHTDLLDARTLQVIKCAAEMLKVVYLKRYSYVYIFILMSPNVFTEN